MIQFGIQNLKTILSTLSYSQLIILTDENTKKDCYPIVSEHLPHHTLLSMQAGEKHKTLATCERLWTQLLDHSVDRNALLINLGGGVVTDLGGYVASCYKRGIRFLNIPTSLLAMVDASIGGKTGINHHHIKNSIGIFAEPVQTIIDTIFLATLPKRHLLNGKAEIMKHGLIASNLHFHNFLSTGEEDNLSPLIKESIDIKHNIVLQDFKEQGLRKVLNFGHTIGHAIESFFLEHKKEDLLHGEAIAIGMIIESYLSVQYTGLSEFLYDNIKRSILNYFALPAVSTSDIEGMLDYILNDKKNAEGKIQMSLIKEIGSAVYNIDVSLTHCKQAMETILL